MNKLKFNKELYSKTALIKAAYNFTDKAYVHLDSDDKYYYVTLDMKESGKEEISEHEFENEMLAQSVRHEIYNQTKILENFYWRELWRQVLLWVRMHWKKSRKTIPFVKMKY